MFDLELPEGPKLLTNFEIGLEKENKSFLRCWWFVRCRCTGKEKTSEEVERALNRQHLSALASAPPLFEPDMAIFSAHAIIA